MSRNELIDAYRRGRISRRSFVKGMTALGVSSAVAAKMAKDLQAAPQGGSQRRPSFQDDVYETPTPTTPAGGTTTLPGTGSGVGDPGSSLWKPVALASAAAAVVAAKLRKIRGAETE